MYLYKVIGALVQNLIFQNGVGGHLWFWPLEKIPGIFGRDMEAKFFIMGPKMSNQSSNLTSQRMVTESRFMTLLNWIDLIYVAYATEGVAENKSCNWIDLISAAYTIEGVAEHSSRLQPSINLHLHAPVTASMFSCSDPKGGKPGRSMCSRSSL